MSLFESVKIGSYVAKNRIALAPMTRARYGENGVPSELNAEYFKQRSSAGLLITDAVGISQEGLGWWLAPGLYTPEQIEGWKKVTSTVHEAGSLIFAQLWHMVLSFYRFSFLYLMNDILIFLCRVVRATQPYSEFNQSHHLLSL